MSTITRNAIAEFSADILGRPRAQGNPQRITTKYSEYPAKTVDHRNLAVATLAEAWSVQHPGHVPLALPVGVYVMAYFTRPRTHYRTGKQSHVLRDDAPELHTLAPDADKIARLVLDALTIAAVLADDKYVAGLRVSKRWAHVDRTKVIVQWAEYASAFVIDDEDYE